MKAGIMRSVKNSVILQILCYPKTPVVTATDWEDPTLVNINHSTSCDRM